MAGTNAGTGQPLYLKCSSCKLLRTESGSTRTGTLVRTGRTRPYKPRGTRARMGRVAYECACTDCGHVGWYAHKDAALTPLRK